MAAPARLILVHKQPTSAHIHFLRFEDGIVAPVPLPKLSQVLGEEESVEDAEVVQHPAMLVGRVATELDMDAKAIRLEGDFHAHVDTPDGAAAIFLGRIDTIDLPFDVAEKAGGRFISLTEARDLTPTELELLRRAYICIME